jgi:hypothetical protein
MSRIVFQSRQNWICGLAVSLKKKSGGLPADSFFSPLLLPAAPSFGEVRAPPIISKLPPISHHEHAKNNNELIPA